jgi:hypothetical protein
MLAVPSPTSSVSATPAPELPASRAVLCNTSPRVRDVLIPLLQRFGFEVVDAFCPPERPPQASVLVVDAERDPRLLDSLGGERGQGAMPFVIAAVGWWSDHEAEVSRAADAVLHVPPRDEQVRAVADALAGRFGTSPPAG